jgi:hypothetical protein
MDSLDNQRAQPPFAWALYRRGAPQEDLIPRFRLAGDQTASSAPSPTRPVAHNGQPHQNPDRRVWPEDGQLRCH